MAVYLQKSNTEPQYGCQTVAQCHAVRRRECLWRTLCCGQGFTQSIAGEPQNLNIAEQRVSNEDTRHDSKGRQTLCDMYLKNKEYGNNLEGWADLTDCLDLVILVGHKIGPPDADWRRV